MKHKTKDFKGVETACNDALTIDPKHVKSLFRRAQVLAAANEFDRALSDLVVAQSVDSKNADVNKLFTAVNARVQASKQRERDMWKNAFGKVELVTKAEDAANKAKAAADDAKRKKEMAEANDEDDIAPPVPVTATGTATGTATAPAPAGGDSAVAAKVDADVSNPATKPAAVNPDSAKA